MAIKVFWTSFAKKELRKIFNYYKEKASLNVAKNLIKGIVKKGILWIFKRKLDNKKNFYSTEMKNSDIWFSKVTKSFIGSTKKKIELKLLTFLIQDNILIK